MGWWRRRSDDDPQPGTPSDPVRPRYGSLRRRNGEVITLMFVPTKDPLTFLGCDAGTGIQVVAHNGDQLSVDVLGPGQSVELGANPHA